METKKRFRRSFAGINGEEYNLETYLWESANILRGHMDASDFKAYIFPLLFYKRISDVYDEEYKKALDESDGDKEYAQSEVNHRFQIPNGAHWDDLRKQTKNIGLYLQKTFRKIEKNNPKTLFGIFGDTNWGNKEKLTDELMNNLIDHFSKIELSNSKIEPDILGRSYEYLIKRFADLTNRKAGEFYTPRSVVKLMTMILDPNDADSIYDPACGTAGMLLEAAEHVKRKDQNYRRLKLYGQEGNLNTAAIARINLFLHGYDDFKIIRNDTLKDPSFLQGNSLQKFDCVIANPPFSLKDWGYSSWKNDPYGRVFAGLPPESYGDYAWVQHMICSAKNDGKVAVVLSSGALSRNLEQKIRKKLIESDLIDTIIQLGPNLFYGTNISPCIIIFKKKKEDNEKNKILMINAFNIFKKGRSQNFLLEEHVEKILELYQSRKNFQGVSKLITTNDVAKNNYNLSIIKYIISEVDEEIFPFNKALKHVKTSFSKLNQSNLKLKEFLQEYSLMVKI